MVMHLRKQVTEEGNVKQEINSHFRVYLVKVSSKHGVRGRAFNHSHRPQEQQDVRFLYVYVFIPCDLKV